MQIYILFADDEPSFSFIDSRSRRNGLKRLHMWQSSRIQQNELALLSEGNKKEDKTEERMGKKVTEMTHYETNADVEGWL